MSPEGRDGHGDDGSTPSHGEEAAAAAEDENGDEDEASPAQHAAAVPSAEEEEVVDTGEDGNADADAPSCAEVAAAARGEHEQHEHEDEDGASTCQARRGEEEGHRRTHPVHVIESGRRRDTLLLVVVLGRRIRNVHNSILPTPPEEPAVAGPSRREAAPQLSRRGRRRRQPHRAHRPSAWSPPRPSPRRSPHRPRCYQRE